jgi:hypothetical protein
MLGYALGKVNEGAVASIANTGHAVFIDAPGESDQALSAFLASLCGGKNGD